MEAPCYQCEKRKPGCHGRCERYLAFDKERQEFREKKRYVIENDQLTNDRIRRFARTRKPAKKR